ncbi:MAG: hypothetical protein JWN61_2274 [Pseudonocardiales bacterium]|nr:hypothetical protein [Pseudonocardiales bacterium]
MTEATRIRAARAVVAAAVLATAVLVVVAVHRPDDKIGELQAEMLALAASLIAAAALPFARLSGRALTIAVLGGAILVQGGGLTAEPSSSDDSYRYLWDGTVQLHGIDPYRYAPNAPELEHLRAEDPHLFPPDAANCPGNTWDSGKQCTRLNRIKVRTIYPPVAEAAFTVMRATSLGGHGGQLPVQGFAFAGSIAIAALVLRRRPMMAALWAWSPIVAIECANNAHIDWLSVLFVVLGLEALQHARARRAAVWLGLAIAVKLTPAILLPVFLQRRFGWVAGIASGVVALSYLPHVLAIGWDVVGYLPGYLNEEGYASGGRFALLDLVMPQSWTRRAAMVVVGLAGLWALWAVRRRVSPVPPELAATTLFGIAMLVTTPDYPWYMLMLLALAVLAGRPQWLPVVVAPSVLYLAGERYTSPWLDRGVYAGAAVLTLVLLAATARRPSQPALSARPTPPMPRDPAAAAS